MYKVVYSIRDVVILHAMAVDRRPTYCEPIRPSFPTHSIEPGHVASSSKIPRAIWRKWAFADIMADAYMKRRDSGLADLAAMAASTELMSKALGSLVQVGR